MEKSATSAISPFCWFNAHRWQAYVYYCFVVIDSLEKNKITFFLPHLAAWMITCMGMIMGTTKCGLTVYDCLSCFTGESRADGRPSAGSCNKIKNKSWQKTRPNLLPTEFFHPYFLRLLSGGGLLDITQAIRDDSCPCFLTTGRYATFACSTAFCNFLSFSSLFPPPPHDRFVSFTNAANAEATRTSVPSFIDFFLPTLLADALTGLLLLLLLQEQFSILHSSANGGWGVRCTNRRFVNYEELGITIN